jgi:3-hydroxyacyl-[acyl-carrier-protein] dehydratase
VYVFIHLPLSTMFEEHLQNLPHGSEFCFIDSIESLENGKSAEGKYTVKGDEVFLKGHFPDLPIMPGVILVESVAQLAGVAVQSDSNSAPLADLRLCAMKNVKIKGTAVPGQVMLISAEVTARLGNLVQAKGAVFVNEEMILSAELTLGGRLDQ